MRNRKGCVWLIGLMLFMTAFPFLWKRTVNWYYGRDIYTPSETPAHRVAIVYGAEVRNGRLSSVLRDRMDTAIQLYHDGIVDRLLVSGDNQFDYYDEPGAMQTYAIARGVAPDDIQTDPSGLRTYDTCYRARHVFGVESAILVTQAFHLPRALFTCRWLGIEAVGTAADLRPYRDARWYEVRETIATSVALWDVIRRQPATIISDPIPFE